MPDSETFDAFYARTVSNVTSQMHELAGDDGTADHAIREAYAKAYQQWYQVSGSRDSEAWVLATAQDAYERRRAEAGGPGHGSAAQDTDSGTWPGFFRPAAQPGGGQGKHLADPDATVAPRRGAAGGGDGSSGGTPGEMPAAWNYPAAGAMAGGAGVAGAGLAGAGVAGAGVAGAGAGGAGPSADQANWLGLASTPTRPTGRLGADGPGHDGLRGGPGRYGPGGGLNRPGSRRNLIIAGVVAAALILGIAYEFGVGHHAPTPATGPGTTGQSAAKSGPHMLPAGRTGSRSAIPWSLVGSGWALTEFSAAQPQAGSAAPVSGSYTTYLVDPAGGKYTVATSSGSPVPQLIAWSGDKQTALFGPPANAAATSSAGAGAGYSLLKVSTGQIISLQLPPDVSAVGFTRPDGLNILAVQHKSGRFWLERYDTQGVFQRKLGSLPSKNGAVWPANGCGFGCALSSPDGFLDVWGIFGDQMHLLSNSGGKVRKLDVPNSRSCVPLSWWDDSTILADCIVSSLPDDTTRLWLVPAEKGSAAKPLTQPTAAGSGRIAGAWQAGNTVYVTSVTPKRCSGVPAESTGLGISPLNQAGSASPMSIPGTTNNVSTVVATSGGRLLVLAQTSCPGTSSLFWFNPSAGTATPVISAPSSLSGVIAAVPYGNGPTALSTGQ